MPTTNVATSATLVSAASARKALILQNNSDTDIWVSVNGNSSVSASAGANQGIKLAASGGNLVLGPNADKAANNKAVYAIHAGSGTKELTYEEIT